MISGSTNRLSITNYIVVGTIKEQVDVLIKVYFKIISRIVETSKSCFNFQCFQCLIVCLVLVQLKADSVDSLLISLTCRAIVACPVGITAAGSCVCQESSMSGALVHAGGPGTLASWPSPSYKAVALSLDAHPSAGAGRIHAVH